MQTENLLGDGRYIAKILGVLDWLETQPSSKDDDIVLVADAYGGFNFYNNWDDKEAHLDGDMWFQLPAEVLVARYHAVIEKANRDLSARMGNAYEKEGIRESILFAAAKRWVSLDAIPPKSALNIMYGACVLLEHWLIAITTTTGVRPTTLEAPLATPFLQVLCLTAYILRRSRASWGPPITNRTANDT